MRPRTTRVRWDMERIPFKSRAASAGWGLNAPRWQARHKDAGILPLSVGGPGAPAWVRRKGLVLSSTRPSRYTRQRPTLPHSYPCSTIGGRRLNYRVRNGNGCDPSPMTTGNMESADAVYRRGPSRRQLEEPGYLLRGKSGYASAAEIEKDPMTTEHPAEDSACLKHARNVNEDKGQASRQISTAKLRTSRSLHTRPITW